MLKSFVGLNSYVLMFCPLNVPKGKLFISSIPSNKHNMKEDERYLDWKREEALRDCERRIREGIKFLAKDPNSFEAFQELKKPQDDYKPSTGRHYPPREREN